MGEKREEKRICKELFIRFGPEGLDHAGLADDLSLSGMYINSATLFPIQTALQLEIYLQDDQKVTTSGIVVWVKDLPPSRDSPAVQGMGIRLDKTPPEYQDFLEGL
ncbi:MAG: PilZ domain-containing protein [Nitrospiria bacterium]